MPVFVDGPYGGIQTRKFTDSDRVLVIAGGSGAGWSLPLAEKFARRHAIARSKVARMQYDDNGSGSGSGSGIFKLDISPPTEPSAAPITRPSSLRLILVTRETATRDWYKRTLNHLLLTHPHIQTSPNFQLEIYLTTTSDNSPDSTSSSYSSSSSPDQSIDVEKFPPNHPHRPQSDFPWPSVPTIHHLRGSRPVEPHRRLSRCARVRTGEYAAGRA